jgi:hypothetical protein
MAERRRFSQLKGEKGMKNTSMDTRSMPDTDDLAKRKVEQKVDRPGQRERAKRDLVTGKKPEGRNPGQGRDGDN